MEYEDLVQKMIQLACVADIPDLKEYAESWNKLAADFRSIGMIHTADTCQRRYQHYRQEAEKTEAQP